MKFKDIHEMMENASCGIVLSTVDGRILEINHAACNLLGYEHNQIIGMHAIEFYADPSQRNVIIAQALSRHKESPIEHIVHINCANDVKDFYLSMIKLGHNERGALLTIFREKNE